MHGGGQKYSRSTCGGNAVRSHFFEPLLHIFMPVYAGVPRTFILDFSDCFASKISTRGFTACLAVGNPNSFF
jgi:hypothetical protein